MADKLKGTIQLRTQTAANWTANNPVLLVGQVGIETDDLAVSPKFKIGDGVTAWNALPYVSAGGGGAVSSVFGRVGAVVAVAGDYDTSEVPDTLNKRYVTDADLTKLSNTSGTNTGDETNATIKTKLGAASALADGYLSSADWSTFNGKQNALGYTAEDSANKTDLMAGNTGSSTKYLSAKGVYDWVIGLGYQVALTAANFGTFINGLTGKTTPVDADEIVIADSADSNKAKKVTFANLKALLLLYFDTKYPYTKSTATAYTSVNTATNEVAAAFLIPAGTALTNAIIDFEARFESNSSANNKIVRMYQSTGATLNGSEVQLATFTFTTNNQYAVFYRDLTVQSATSVWGVAPTQSFSGDLGGNQFAGVASTVNTFVNDCYFIITVNRANAGDTLILRSAQITITNSR